MPIKEDIEKLQSMENDIREAKVAKEQVNRLATAINVKESILEELEEQNKSILSTIAKNKELNLQFESGLEANEQTVKSSNKERDDAVAESTEEVAKLKAVKKELADTKAENEQEKLKVANEEKTLRNKLQALVSDISMQMANVSAGVIQINSVLDSIKSRL